MRRRSKPARRLELTQSEQRADCLMRRAGIYVEIMKLVDNERQKYFERLFESSRHTAIATGVGAIFFAVSWPSLKMADFPGVLSVLGFIASFLAPFGYWRLTTRKRNLRYYSYGDGETGEGFWGEKIVNARFAILLEMFKKK